MGVFMKKAFLCVMATVAVGSLVSCASSSKKNTEAATQSANETATEASINTTADATPVDENERAMSHINYIQYELAKIHTSGNRFTVAAEMDNILNSINPTSLKHPNLSDAYKDILGTLTDLKASHEEQKILEKEMEQKRGNAIFNAFSGLGAAFLNPNPVALASALVMSGFNYARTVNEIENEGTISSMKIDATRIKSIDEARINLWESAAKIYQNNSYESTTFIEEKMMSNYMNAEYELQKALGQEDEKTVALKTYTYLSLPEIENQFKYFLPYHLTLLKAGYVEDDAEKVKYRYKKIVELSNAEYKRFYIKNPYLYEATKYAFLFLMKHENESFEGIPTDFMLSLFKAEGNKSLISIVDDEYFVISVYEFFNKLGLGQYDAKIKESLALLKKLNVENDTTDLNSKYMCLESINKDNDYCRRLSKKVASDQLKKAVFEFEENGDFKMTFPIDAVFTATCVDRKQESIIIGAWDRKEERQHCLDVVTTIQKVENDGVYEYRIQNLGTLKHVNLKINVMFNMGIWNASANGVADNQNEMTKPLELETLE